jgi:nitrate/nitrite transport system ATP-binding protein
MTDGPAAEVGDIVSVNFPRPRERKAVMEHPDYYPLRERLIEFLEVHAHRHQPKPPTNPTVPAPSKSNPQPQPETACP